MDEPEKNNSPNRSRHERADETERNDAEQPEDKTSDEGSKNPYNEVPHETETLTACQLSRKPPCHNPDNEKPEPVDSTPLTSFLLFFDPSTVLCSVYHAFPSQTSAVSTSAMERRTVIDLFSVTHDLLK